MMKTFKKGLIALLVTAHIGNAFTQQNPIAYATDLRIKHVSWQENNVVPIHGMAFTATQVVFGKDERVLTVEGGDSAVWMVTRHATLPNMVFIKPTYLGSNSNITIVTNKHSYYFHVTSNRQLDERPSAQTYAIQFIYPEEEAKRLKAHALKAQKTQKEIINPIKNPEAYNWNYRFSGSTQLAPLHVFDDGKFTYFELGKNQAVPAIFAVDDKQGKESVVNTRREGAYIVVQRIAPQFTLRSGGIVTSVFNTEEINRIKQDRRPS